MILLSAFGHVYMNYFAALCGVCSAVAYYYYLVDIGAE